MAIVPLEKIHIVVHKSIKEKFLYALQKHGLVHITELREETAKGPDDLMKINEALAMLAAYKKRGILETFIKIKKPISFTAFEEKVRNYNYKKTVEELERIKSEKEKNQVRAHTVKEHINLLIPWQSITYDLSLLGSFKQTEAIPCIISSKEVLNKITEKLNKIPHSYEIVNAAGTALYYIFFVKQEQAHLFRSILIENECEIIDFKGFKGKPQDIISSLERESREINEYLKKLNQKEIELAHEISMLELTYDLFINEQRKNEVAQNLPETKCTINIIGWIKKQDITALDEMIKKVELAVYERITPAKGERPPVALKNPKWSQPYETLIKLYSMPKPDEFDPTPFLAFFFPIFFALCLTDAVYGMVLIAFSLYLLKKVAGDRSLIWIILAGGILTIFAGAMLGGWVGDLFEYIGLKPLIEFRKAFMLFDPLKSPMIFIGIALGLGFIHMMIGIGIEIFDSIKNKNYGQAIFANLTWFIFLPSILLYFMVFNSSIIAKMILEIVLWLCIVGIIIGSHPEGKPALFDQLIWAPIILLVWVLLTSTMGKVIGFKYQLQIPGYVYALLIPLLIIESLRFKYAKEVLAKIAWGLYNLYGISSYLGVILSYVRLMALGMVTGVIAIAINKIAWMITGVPVIGFILVILILIPSHLFNIVINALGGFIHTMRLQYIEFFGRFYTGGSKLFKPFGFETNYVEFE